MIPRNFVLAVGILCALALAMSLYLWRLRRRETFSPSAAGAASAHVAPPTSGPTEKVTMVVAFDDRGELRAQTLAIPLSSNRQSRMQEILRGLLTIYQADNSPHKVAPAAEIRAVYLLDSGDAIVDVNSAFVEGQASGILAEELTVASIVQTISVNFPNVGRVKILTDGKDRESLAGHVDLSGFYDVSEMSDLARALWAQ